MGRGGSVIADYGTAITDEQGKGFEVSPLNELFGIDRRKDQSWFEGKRRFEINGEKYQQPFLNRLAAEGCLSNDPFTVIESVLGSTHFENRFGSGSSIFLNASPTAIFVSTARAGAIGKVCREWLGTWLAKRGIAIVPNP